MFGMGRVGMAISGGIFRPLLLIAIIGVSPLSAQTAETRGDQSPALIAGRDAIVNYGLTPEQGAGAHQGRCCGCRWTACV
jgi:hypothetical protein